jgi:hypothetical protein
MSEKILKLLSDLHAFNLLTERIVKIIGDSFNVDAVDMCREHGITYKSKPAL